MIKIKIIYQNPEKEDGFRILVDRSLDKAAIHKAHVDLWLKKIAPSIELNKRFNKDSNRY